MLVRLRFPAYANRLGKVREGSTSAPCENTSESNRVGVRNRGWIYETHCRLPFHTRAVHADGLPDHRSTEERHTGSYVSEDTFNRIELRQNHRGMGDGHPWGPHQPAARPWKTARRSGNGPTPNTGKVTVRSSFFSGAARGSKLPVMPLSKFATELSSTPGGSDLFGSCLCP